MSNQKSVLLVVNQVMNLVAQLLENIIFMESDWNNSNKIFEHFSILLKSFTTKTTDATDYLLSVTEDTISQNQSSTRKTEFGISANLVMDDKSFRVFYSSFSMLINKQIEMMKAIDTRNWFEAEYHLMNRLRSFSPKYLIEQ